MHVGRLPASWSLLVFCLTHMQWLSVQLDCDKLVCESSKTAHEGLRLHGKSATESMQLRHGLEACVKRIKQDMAAP